MIAIEAAHGAAPRGRGKSAKSLALIEASHRILTEIQPASVRAVCYKLFNEKLIKSMAKSETNKVGVQLTWAREQGIIPWAWIVDGTRAIERRPSWSSPESVLRSAANGYRRDWWEQQPVQVLLFSEKSTVAGTVKPITDQYGVGSLSVHGYGSTTSTHDVAVLSTRTDKPMILIYIGDYDPSGMHMSEVDLPGRLERYGGQAQIVRIALTQADAAAGTLQSFSADEKRQDPRYKWFVGRYGRTCVELDALDPRVLRERIEEQIRTHIDWAAWERCIKVEAAERASLLDVVGAWKAAQA